MESLTQEFWDKLYAKYPSEVQVFCDWIDEYKESVNWNTLFGSNYVPYDFIPKYHDLPIAMQIGIFMQFVMEGDHQYFFEVSTSLSFDQLKDEIVEWFCQEHDAKIQDHFESKYVQDTDSD